MRRRISDGRPTSILSLRSILTLPLYLTTLLFNLQFHSLLATAAADETTVVATSTMTLINTITRPGPPPTPIGNATITGTASYGGLLPIATGISPASPDYAFADDVAFATGLLNAVNTLRAKHGAQPLAWNATLATYAGWWANRCNFTNSFSPYTELLLQNASAPTSSVIATWADTSYTPASARRADNYTALIWKASTSIGCGRQQCSDKPTNSPFVDPSDVAQAHKEAAGTATAAAWDTWDKDESTAEGELGVLHGASTAATAVPAAGWFVVCEVAPLGNVDGLYAANVDGWGDGSARGEGWRQEGVLGKVKDDKLTTTSGAGMAAGAGKEKVAVWAGWVFAALAATIGVWA